VLIPPKVPACLKRLGSAKNFSTYPGTPRIVFGKYGAICVPHPARGAATSKIGKERIRYVFEQKNKGNLSPNAIAVKRDDLESFLSEVDKSRTTDQIKEGMYEHDPTPGKAVQLFAVVRNPERGGIVEFVEIGMIPSDFRLNRATHKDHVAFNQHPAVLDWHASGGQKGLPPLSPENHKATIFDEMTK